MLIEPLAISGAWSLVPTIHSDDRGAFCEWMRQDTLESLLGHRLDLAQANCSTSRAGVVRGVHYADVPPGQAKYVTCVSGSIVDVVVDLRVGSPTFGAWDAVELSGASRQAVYIGEGLGHAFMAVSDATVVYLCSTQYAPAREHGIDPFDPDLAIRWPSTNATGAPFTPVLSAKDRAQPSLASAAAAGRLPTFSDADRLYADRVG